MHAVVAAWAERHPTFEHRYYDDAAVWLFMRSASPALLRAFELRDIAPVWRAFFGAFRHTANVVRADLFRLFLLHEVGGVWADADTTPPPRASSALLDSLIRPLDEFVLASNVCQPSGCLPAWDVRPAGSEAIGLDNYAMASVAGHPFLAEALEQSVNMLLTPSEAAERYVRAGLSKLHPDQRESVVSLAGPRRLNAAVERVLGRQIAPGERGRITFASQTPPWDPFAVRSGSSSSAALPTRGIHSSSSRRTHSYTVVPGGIGAQPKYTCKQCALDPEYIRELAALNITHWAAEGTG